MILPGVPALSASGSHFQGVTRLLLENLMLSHAHEEEDKKTKPTALFPRAIHVCSGCSWEATGDS